MDTLHNGLLNNASKFIVMKQVIVTKGGLLTPAAIIIRHLRPLIFALFLSPHLLSAGSAKASSNGEPCPTGTKASIASAREALHSHDASAERTALLRLVEAVAAIDERLSDTLAGRVEFEKITSKAYYPSTTGTITGAK
jgi:hypothetical protein